ARYLAGYEVFERRLTEGLITRFGAALSEDLRLPVLSAVGLGVLRAEFPRWCEKDDRSLPEMVDTAFETLEQHVLARAKEQDHERC
ncbi:MAG: hypothetical protein JO285_16130, partial [Kutzneria sp.]|nr:hypothetical protein [Kutzneria sp.]